jgi:hypothetical protein
MGRLHCALWRVLYFQHCSFDRCVSARRYFVFSEMYCTSTICFSFACMYYLDWICHHRNFALQLPVRARSSANPYGKKHVVSDPRAATMGVKLKPGTPQPPARLNDRLRRHSSDQSDHASRREQTIFAEASRECAHRSEQTPKRVSRSSSGACNITQIVLQRADKQNRSH